MTATEASASYKRQRKSAIVMGLFGFIMTFGAFFYMMFALSTGQFLEGKAFANPCPPGSTFQKTCYIQGKVTGVNATSSVDGSVVNVSAPSVSAKNYSFTIRSGYDLPKVGQQVKMINSSATIPWLTGSVLEIDAQNPGAIGYTIPWLLVIGGPVLFALFAGSLLYFPLASQAKRWQEYEVEKNQTEVELVNKMAVAPTKTAFTFSKGEELAQVLSAARSSLEKVWIDSEHLENGDWIAYKAYNLREDVLELENSLHKSLKVIQEAS